jgi:ubiquinone/menaquinone biosynthesis C-methylase UbiE
MEIILPNNNFYDELASDYDDMISFEKSVENKKKQLKNFLTSEIKSAADIGCGSGVDSIALTLLGVKISAFDPSVEMLKVAQSNTDAANANIEFYNYAVNNIPKEFDNQFDMVVSLGNTFANISSEIIFDSLKRCYEILKPKGKILIQVLNFEKILADRQRIVNITEGNDKYFIRFYDFLEEQIVFNILTFNTKNLSERKLISTKIYPHSSQNFVYNLGKAGFNSFQLFGNLELSDFSTMKSKDLIIIASRN